MSQSDDDAPLWVVRNHQRLDVSGLGYPGCRKCNHVYAHADDCEYVQTEFVVKIFPKIKRN